MKKLFLMAFAALVLGACNSEPTFEVKGEITGAEGKMLYFEAAALEGIIALDSVKLGSGGTFKFEQAEPESPEFYRLRIEDKVINFSIDSTETVKIKAPYKEYATAYTVEGSVNSVKIKELTLKQIELQAEVDKLVKQRQENKITVAAFEESFLQTMKRYKDDVKMNYIFAAPNSAAAYFALFQRLNGYQIFDPLNNREDIRCFQSVATFLNNAYPHADRSRNLYNIVVKGLKNTREVKQQVVEIPQEAITETGIIDIALRDLKGNTHKLSDLKGKVVLIDFTLYQAENSAAHNYMLLDLYQKYAKRGLEIYQISLDPNEHYWKVTADNLPWICVRDANGIYSTVASAYNVQTLPSIFLVNKKNELSGRGEMIKDLEAEIKKLL